MHNQTLQHKCKINQKVLQSSFVPLPTFGFALLSAIAGFFASEVDIALLFLTKTSSSFDYSFLAFSWCFELIKEKSSLKLYSLLHILSAGSSFFVKRLIGILFDKSVSLRRRGINIQS